MKNISKLLIALSLALPLGVIQYLAPEAQAQSSYFSSRGCVSCHATPVVATCAGCHEHSGSLTATKNKTTSYAPGETVTVTLTSSGARSGWIGARLYNQSGVEVARSTGNQSGMGGSAVYPAVLSAPAPAAAGTYTWRIAYLGNQNGTGSGDVHAEKSVNVSITVAAAAPAADTTAPVVSTFTLPATATSLTVPVSALTAADNVAVSGYLINKSSAAPAASAAGWTAAKPASVTAVAGINIFYAWAKDAAGNVSAAKSATVTVTTTTADATPPTLTVSALANGAATNKNTLNVSGSATDAGGLKSVTVNGQPVVVNTGGSFSTALNLVAGANVITVVATDNAGNQNTDSRTITYDLAAPVLTVSNPADNSTSAQSFVTVSGSVNENSTVTIKVNNGSAQSAAMNGTNFSATANLAAGINTIDIAAIDLAGNTTSAKRTVTYSAPASQLTLAVTTPAQDVTTSRSSMTIQGAVKDAAGSIRVTVKINDRTYYPRVGSTGNFSQSVTFSSTRTYVITVTARDAAGHTATVTRNVIYRTYDRDDDDDDDNDDNDDNDGSTGGTTSHPFGWTDPRSSHDNYVESNGVSGCTSCHSVDLASKGQPMSCYNCHGKEWDTPSTGGSTGGTTSHPFGWTDPRSSHDNYVESNGVSSCVSCHSTDLASKGQPMSCYNCHGKEW